MKPILNRRKQRELRTEKWFLLLCFLCFLLFKSDNTSYSRKC
jgi:hypothetical protein